MPLNAAIAKAPLRFSHSGSSMAAEDEKDYSEYIRHLDSANHGMSLFAGFTLTTFVLVISLFSDRSAPLVQATLYLLCFLFYLFVFLLAWIGNLDLNFIKNIPPQTTGMKLSSFLEFLGIALLGWMMPLLFLFFDLLLLSALSIMTWAIFFIVSYFSIMKPVGKAQLKSNR
jgi:hypothetical protein